jgi:hypothetical protein
MIKISDLEKRVISLENMNTDFANEVQNLVNGVDSLMKYKEKLDFIKKKHNLRN